MAEIRIEADWEGLGDVQDMLKRVEHVLEPPGLTEVLGVGADVFVDTAAETAPKRSGDLARSMHKDNDGDGWLIAPNTVYANIQNKGGDNYAVNGAPMVFQIDGKTIFTEHVHVPGSHYMQDAFELGRGPAAEAVAQAVDAAIES